jgi:hypothetical protein
MTEKNKKCNYCGCWKKGRHKIWCRSEEAKEIRKELGIENEKRKK